MLNDGNKYSWGDCTEVEICKLENSSSIFSHNLRFVKRKIDLMLGKMTSLLFLRVRYTIIHNPFRKKIPHVISNIFPQFLYGPEKIIHFLQPTTVWDPVWDLSPSKRKLGKKETETTDVFQIIFDHLRCQSQILPSCVSASLVLAIFPLGLTTSKVVERSANPRKWMNENGSICY